MSVKIKRSVYADMFGPTAGDRVRLADTDLIIEVEKDFTTYGEEVKFGGGKVNDIRLIAAPLPLHAVVTARGELGSFGDKTQAGEHGFTVSLCYRLPFGAPCSLPPCGGGLGRGVQLAPPPEG